jgi:hypothetical protein
MPAITGSTAFISIAGRIDVRTSTSCPRRWIGRLSSTLRVTEGLVGSAIWRNLQRQALAISLDAPQRTRFEES